MTTSETLTSDSDARNVQAYGQGVIKGMPPWYLVSTVRHSLENQFICLAITRQAYEAAVKVFQTTDEMMRILHANTPEDPKDYPEHCQ